MDHLYSKSCVGSWPIDYMKSMIHRLYGLVYAYSVYTDYG